MKLSLIVPVYNEEETIPLFYKAVREFAPFQSFQVEIVFINDGSKDKTEVIINTLAQADDLIIPLNFTRNFGKEAALIAGIDYATGDAVIPMDVDLQDPIEIIPEMIEKWQAGADVVLAKRIDRSTDSFLKRFTASVFYKIHNQISHPKIQENAGDFRLMSREIVEHIKHLKERNLFIKGLFSWVGGQIDTVEYVRPVRVAGKTKFNVLKLWNLALEGITSFSTIPLRMWTYIGLLFASVAFVYGGWMILDTLIWGNDVKGYPSLLASILFLGGIQLIGIGVLGEYIGRIYMETKQRPIYLLKSSKNIKN